jgi:hypothetical protein
MAAAGHTEDTSSDLQQRYDLEEFRKQTKATLARDQHHSTSALYVEPHHA